MFKLTSTHTAFDQPTLITSVLLRNSSFLIQYIHVTLHILLKHLLSIKYFPFFSGTPILQVAVPYSAVGTATPSYNLLFTIIPIPQLNTFIPHNIFPILLILDFTSATIHPSTVILDP